MSDLDPYLRATTAVDADSAVVRAFVDRVIGCIEDSPKEQALALYYAVRDEVRYDPYAIDLTVEGLSASRALETGRGWCVPKAVLLAAALRAIGIPARLGYADVRNHMSTARMREQMGTDLFVWHGYTDVWLDGRWIKATPAFNIELCERFGLLPLEWDGESDSIYHPFDASGNRHMEYVNDRGTYADLPLVQIVQSFAQVYPGMSNEALNADADFMTDVIRETQRN